MNKVSFKDFPAVEIEGDAPAVAQPEVEIEDDEPAVAQPEVEIEDDEPAVVAQPEVEIEDDEPAVVAQPGEEFTVEKTPGEAEKIRLRHYEGSYYLIEGTNVVMSLESYMVVGVLNHSKLLCYPVKELREVCAQYGLLYFDTVLRECSMG